jgi:ubiquinone/menaquinone biosynthesis C-methylase UbiE
MPDVYSMISDLDRATQERIADVLETRGADPQQQAMRRSFLNEIPFPDRTRALEVGCGTGVMCRLLARWPNVGSVVGVDPAGLLVQKAREASGDFDNLTFQEADGRSLPFGEGEFNAVIFDSTLCHMPEPERGLAEAFRVLVPGGWLAAFDGDYTTTTVALSDNDPLQRCVDAMMAHSLNDPRLVRRLAPLVRSAGFEVRALRGYSFIETGESSYMLSIIDRGADFLSTAGELGKETAAALKDEARRRVQAGTFFGHIAYAGVIARKPG